ncbi:cache domain-containing protein [Nitrosopumilus zosterae]|uniref:cache domain-containing protein n=1 Tax=Nitrosopumilus zosterae TaxID=718286 RepID=UPI00135C9FCF|nr:cache domain-containing protein [Nitrosopumilus zosterae]BDQ30491.1 HAMP domain-containing protein [Nitrosopumilus zosterae]
MVAIFATSYLSFNSAEKILKENTQNLLIGEASLRGESVENILEERKKDIQVLAQNPELHQLLQTYDENNSSLLNVQRQSFLKIINEYQITIGYSINLEDIKITNKEGTLLFSLIDLKSSNVSDIFESRNSDAVTTPSVEFKILDNNTRKLIVIHPIFEQNSKNILGLLIATIRTTDIDEILLNRSGLGNTGEVYLVNKNHTLISESRFMENIAFNQMVNTLPVTQCFENNADVHGDTYFDYRGESIFGASYCSPNSGFVLIAEIDESETFGPVTALQKEILIVGIIVTSIIGIIAFVLGNLISRPLVKLINAVNQVSDGNFEVRTNIRTKDEIGLLSLAFDSMTKKMQEALISIKQRDDVIKQQEEELLKFSDSDNSYCVGFVDIVNSTKITSSLSDSDTDTFYSIFLNSIASVITKYDGLVVKNIGDALLFYFPRTNQTEDLNAFKKVLDCCIAIVDEHIQINQKMLKNKLPKTDYRISITYGSVRIAKVFTSSVEDIFGSTVNKCSKINRLATTNGVVIGKSLYDLVASFSNDFDFKKIESKEMKDKYGYEAVYSVSKH